MNQTTEPPTMANVRKMASANNAIMGSLYGSERGTSKRERARVLNRVEAGA